MNLPESARVIDATCSHNRRNSLPLAGICFISKNFVYTFFMPNEQFAILQELIKKCFPDFILIQLEIKNTKLIPQSQAERLGLYSYIIVACIQQAGKSSLICSINANTVGKFIAENNPCANIPAIQILFCFKPIPRVRAYAKKSFP